MALPTSGPLSISAIRTELGSTSGSLRTLSAAAGFSTPDSMYEFYGYSAMTPPTINYAYPYTVTGLGTVADPYTFTFDANSVVGSLDPGMALYETPYGSFTFTAQTTGAYRIHANILSRDLPGLADAQNGFYLYFRPPYFGVYIAVERSAGQDSALAAIALPTDTGESTTVVSAGSQLAMMEVQVYNTYYFTFNSLTFTIGFELI